MIKTRCFHRFAAAIAVALSATVAADAADLVKFDGVTAQGGPTAQMFPIFMAQEKGFYEEEGLDVTLNYSKGSSDAARQLAAGNVDWGIFASAAAMITVQRGFPLKAIMQVYYPDSFDIVVPADSEVQTIADLKGKIIGVSDLAGGEVPMTRASILESGLKEGPDVRLVIAGEGDPTTVRSLNEGRIQAYSGAKRDLLLLPAQGIPTRSITPEKITRFPGDALMVREETFDDDKETLIKFVRATLKGWAWGMGIEGQVAVSFRVLADTDKNVLAWVALNAAGVLENARVRARRLNLDSVQVHGMIGGDVDLELMVGAVERVVAAVEEGDIVGVGCGREPCRRHVSALQVLVPDRKPQSYSCQACSNFPCANKARPRFQCESFAPSLTFRARVRNFSASAYRPRDRQTEPALVKRLMSSGVCSNPAVTASMAPDSSPMFRKETARLLYDSP